MTPFLPPVAPRSQNLAKMVQPSDLAVNYADPQGGKYVPLEEPKYAAGAIQCSDKMYCTIH